MLPVQVLVAGFTLLQMEFEKEKAIGGKPMAFYVEARMNRAVRLN